MDLEYLQVTVLREEEEEDQPMDLKMTQKIYTTKRLSQHFTFQFIENFRLKLSCVINFHLLMLLVWILIISYVTSDWLVFSIPKLFPL